MILLVGYTTGLCQENERGWEGGGTRRKGSGREEGRRNGRKEEKKEELGSTVGGEGRRNILLVVVSQEHLHAATF